jgi:hypothetical protein
MKEDLATAGPVATVEFRDDGRYEIACPKGHKAVTLLQQQRFEILFDIGAYAIGDGYYREAVSSFAASLERLYEFFIHAVMYQKGIDDDAIEKAWSQVAALSERQLGAFIFIYTIELGRPPNVQTEKAVKFRNAVIHKGKIPTRQEAVQYGQQILNIARPIIAEAKQRLPDGVKKTITKHLSKAAGGATEAVTFSRPTILNLARAEPDQRSLEEAMASLPRWR